MSTESGIRVSGGGVSVLVTGSNVTDVEDAVGQALRAEGSTTERVRIIHGAALPTHAVLGIERHSELVRQANRGIEEAEIDVDGVRTMVPILAAIDRVREWTLASLCETDRIEANVQMMIAQAQFAEIVP